MSTVSNGQQRRPGFFLLSVCLSVSLTSRSSSLVAQSCLTLCDCVDSFTNKCGKWRLGGGIADVLMEVG